MYGWMIFFRRRWEVILKKSPWAAEKLGTPFDIGNAFAEHTIYGRPFGAVVKGIAIGAGGLRFDSQADEKSPITCYFCDVPSNCVVHARAVASRTSLGGRNKSQGGRKK